MILRPKHRLGGSSYNLCKATCVLWKYISVTVPLSTQEHGGGGGGICMQWTSILQMGSTVRDSSGLAQAFIGKEQL